MDELGERRPRQWSAAIRNQWRAWQGGAAVKREGRPRQGCTTIGNQRWTRQWSTAIGQNHSFRLRICWVRESLAVSSRNGSKRQRNETYAQNF